MKTRSRTNLVLASLESGSSAQLATRPDTTRSTPGSRCLPASSHVSALFYPQLVPEIVQHQGSAQGPGLDDFHPAGGAGGNGLPSLRLLADWRRPEVVPRTLRRSQVSAADGVGTVRPESCGGLAGGSPAWVMANSPVAGGWRKGRPDRQSVTTKSPWAASKRLVRTMRNPDAPSSLTCGSRAGRATAKAMDSAGSLEQHR